MTKSKNHNSIVFLTTLGVYLGLVLAGGASPQVFAHSALTRHFEIQDEIEVKDDLDKKPEPAAEESDDKSSAELTAGIFESVKSLLSQFSRTQPVSAFGPAPDFVFSGKRLDNGPTINVIDSNASSGFRKSQTLVITRLPRASIDPLLAVNNVQ
jgi:hypothetical protein